ncbi:MAG: c-type cytochrome [Epsilonproteobacteria bacterium]|nr:c-type cytochrome [Campylobacterota bacterium]
MKKLYFLLLPSLLLANEELYSSLGCYGCHGIDAKGGNGFPPLANKPKEYLIKRLFQYKEGKLTSNRAQMMQPYAKNLTPQQIQELATYLSNLKPDQSQEYYEEYDLSDAM